MDEKKMFKRENLLFVSMRDNVIGSLYFRAVEEGRIYRGRIRLYHDRGPQVRVRNKPEVYWRLGDEEWFNSKEVRGKVWGDLCRDVKSTLEKAAGKNIYERYTNGHHPSRGVLVAPCRDITQAHIDRLIAEIHHFTDEEGKCEPTKVDEANQAIIKLTSGKDMPCCLKQVKGKYGC